MGLISDAYIKIMADLVISCKSSEHSYSQYNEIRIMIRNYLEKQETTNKQIGTFDKMTKSAPIRSGHFRSYDDA